MYSVCIDRDQSRLEQLEVSLFLIVCVICQLTYNIKFLAIYNLKSDSFLAIWEFECLELRHHSISILGSSFLKIYFLYIFVWYRSYFKNLIHNQDGKDSCLDGA